MINDKVKKAVVLKLKMTALFLLLQLISVVLSKFLISPFITGDVYKDIEYYVAIIIMLPIVLFVSKRDEFNLPNEFFNFNVDFSFFWKVIAVVFFYFLIFYCLAEFLNISDESDIFEIINVLNKGSIYVKVLLVFSICLAAPIIEEIFFRGWLISKLMMLDVDKNYIIITTSTLFMFSHMQYQNVFSYIYLFIMGFGLGYIRMKKNNISYCILAHSFLNFLAVFSWIY